MRNLYKAFRDLIPDAPLQAGTVIAADGPIYTIQLPGGGLLQARGIATVGQQVFVRDGVIEGDAPALTLVVTEV